jgi:signal peptidase I
MSRTASRTAPAPPTKPLVDPAVGHKPKETMRDFVEQIVVAIILAVLIRGYDAEAFVIPTGSMAPTLMGRHKEVSCPECGLVYAINASEDIEEYVAKSRDKDAHEVGLCVNCRYRTVVDDAPSFKGDRILVMKFPYELPFLPGSAGPRRWDVVVFHFPEKPETNYIKRLVGLPGDELRVNHGDLEARQAGGNEPFRILRKPLFHQRAMQMLVYDDSHRPRSMEGKPEWRRWNPQGEWKEEPDGKFLATPSVDKSWSELRYRHLLPDVAQWAALSKNETPSRGPRATLITDFYSYNTNTSAGPSYDSWLQKNEGWLQTNWVGDLTISGRVEVESVQEGSALKLELIEAGISNRCEVDLETGLVSLYHGDKKLGEAGSSLRGIGSHDVEFANVDDRLTLWIDGETPFDEGLPYDDSPTTPHFPTAKDLDPVGIAIKNAKASVSGLVLKRDIYYTQDPRYPDYMIPGVNESIERDATNENSRLDKLFEFLSEPERFAALKDLTSRETYVIKPDRFMMMGDNSPRSSDSRAWSSQDDNWRDDNVDRSKWEVPREMLIGKAFFVYWPHGKPFWPNFGLSRDVRVPFRPYFERMKWIR